MVAVHGYCHDSTCAVRVHSLLAAAINQVCGEKLADEKTIQAVLGDLPLIEGQAAENCGRLWKRLKFTQGATVRSLADEGFIAASLGFGPTPHVRRWRLPGVHRLPEEQGFCRGHEG